MRKTALKAAMAAALFLVPGTARAQDNPSLAGFTVLSTGFFVPTGVTTLDVQFLFGRGANSNTLFYQVGASQWIKILTTDGSTFPAQIPTPAPGTIFSGLSLFGAMVGTEVKFAVCTGSLATTANLATTCGAVSNQEGPFISGIGASNYRALTGAQWNTVRAGISPDGATTAYSTVFGVEDVKLATADKDFNDVVFATNLSTTVPEPSTVALVAFGMLGMAGVARRRKLNS